jgi:alpha-amylase
LAQEQTPHGIAALVRAHQSYAGGRTQVLFADDDLYVMQRLGYGGQPGLVYILNNRGDAWNGTRVTTRWRDAEFTPVAWWGRTDLNRPEVQRSQSDGSAQFWAPPRGYVVYRPRS